jgi:hypothetical protein
MTDDDWFTNGASGSVWAVYWLPIAWKGYWDLARTLGCATSFGILIWLNQKVK